MNVLILASNPPDTSPGSRFRIEQWAKILSEQGFSFTYVPFDDQGLYRVLYSRGKFIAKASGMIRGVLRRIALLRGRSRLHFDFYYAVICEGPDETVCVWSVGPYQSIRTIRTRFELETWAKTPFQIGMWADYIKAETAKWSRVIKEANITLD